MAQFKVAWAGDVAVLAFPQSHLIKKGFYVKRAPPWSHYRPGYKNKFSKKQKEWQGHFVSVAPEVMKQTEKPVLERRKIISERLKELARRYGFGKEKRAVATA